MLKFLSSILGVISQRSTVDCHHDCTINHFYHVCTNFGDLNLMSAEVKNISDLFAVDNHMLSTCHTSCMTAVNDFLMTYAHACGKSLCRCSEVCGFISAECISLTSIILVKCYNIWVSSFSCCHVKYLIRLVRVLK